MPIITFIGGPLDGCKLEHESQGPRLLICFESILPNHEYKIIDKKAEYVGRWPYVYTDGLGNYFT